MEIVRQLLGHFVSRVPRSPASIWNHDLRRKNSEALPNQKSCSSSSPESIFTTPPEKGTDTTPYSTAFSGNKTNHPGVGQRDIPPSCLKSNQWYIKTSRYRPLLPHHRANSPTTRALTLPRIRNKRNVWSQWPRHAPRCRPSSLSKKVHNHYAPKVAPGSIVLHSTWPYVSRLPRKGQQLGESIKGFSRRIQNYFLACQSKCESIQ